MNKYNKYIIFASLMFAAISVSNTINAFSFPIANNSGKNLLVQVELASDKTPYFDYTPSGATADFSWPASTGKGGFRLNNIKCVVVDDALYKQLKAKNILDKNDKIVSNDTTLAWINNQSTDPRVTATITGKGPAEKKADAAGQYWSVYTFGSGYKFIITAADKSQVTVLWEYAK